MGCASGDHRNPALGGSAGKSAIPAQASGLSPYQTHGARTRRARERSCRGAITQALLGNEKSRAKSRDFFAAFRQSYGVASDFAWNDRNTICVIRITRG